MLSFQRNFEVYSLMRHMIVQNAVWPVRWESLLPAAVEAINDATKSSPLLKAKRRNCQSAEWYVKNLTVK